MNCDEVCRLLAAARPLPPEALEHAAACPVCSELDAAGRGGVDRAVDAAVEQRIVAALASDLGPVRPLRPVWVYALAILAAAAVVAAAGVRLLGTRGWQADSGFEKAYFTVCLAAALGLSAVLSARLMAPASRLPVTPGATALLSSLFLGAGTVLYPAVYYAHFGKAVAACLTIGLTHAAVVSGFVLWIARRGAFLSRPQVAIAIALVGGLAGAVVLFVFCPHRDLGHIALAHATVPAAAAGLGAAMGGLRARRRL